MEAEIRRRFNDLIDQQMRALDFERARKTAAAAVQQGYWRSPLQRPLHFVPTLPAEPVHDGHRYWVARFLESNFETIRDEALAVLARGTQPFSPVEEPLTNAGRWDMAPFWEGGVRLETTCREFPRTASIVEQLPEEVRRAGVIMFSCLQPGTHIVPHCGHTNARLRTHLPILTSPKARMRVGERILNWVEGECLVFDDSFEHEVWHDGDSPRLVLLVDMLHPALAAEERAALLSQAEPSHAERARTFLERSELEQVRFDGAGELRVRLRGETEKRVRRHMLAAGARAIWLDESGGLQVEKGPPA
jgi:aspartyl/asparaginyl beta-hydroxylase (cupin superfamily)